jgi:hypothetical protein
LAEGVVIVGSILLALAADAWWDDHRDRQRERSLVESLLEDFAASRPGLESRVQLARRMATGNAALLDLLDPAVGGPTAAVPDSLVLAVLGSPTYEPVMNSLDAALASGEIELLQNRELRANLADWRRRLADSTEDELEARRITNEHLVPLLARSLDLAPYFEAVLPWSGGDPYGPGQIIEGRTALSLPGGVVVPVSTELSGALALRHFFVEFSAADLTELLTLLDQTVELLRAEIDG